MLRHQHFLWFLSMWGYSLCCPSSCTCNSHRSVYCNNPQQMFDSIPTDIPSNTIYLFFDHQLLQNLSSLNCYQLPNLQYLNIYSNQIEVIEDTDFLGCSSLITLNIQNNLLTEIRNETFKGLTSLQTLYMQNNSLTEIQNGFFNSMASLQQLHLSDNKITKLENGAFINLPALRYLYMQNNLLTEIQNETFNSMPSLQQLYLSNNEISDLETGAFKDLPALSQLYLSNNKISEIDTGAFINLAALYSLNLEHNLLTNMNNGTFEGMTGNLRTFILNYNEISHIEDGTFLRIHGLQNLYLEHNSLTEINNNTFAGLKGNLQYLDLRHNLLTNIAIGSLDHLTGLRHLYLDGNMIYDALFFEFLPTTLYSLSMKNNSIDDIANGTFSRLSQLNNLYLDGNRISDLSFVASISNSLRHLSLNNNSLSDLPDSQFDRLTGLQILYLDGNMIDDLPFVESLSSVLYFLSLNNNSISFIQNGTFAGLTSLQYLYLDGNSISDLMFVRTLSYIMYELSLNRNELTELEIGILDRFTNLHLLSLISNGLTELENGIFDRLTNLGSLDLSSNRISHISWDTFSSNINLYKLNLNDNPVSCGHTTAEIFLNFTWNNWLNIHNDIRFPQSCIQTPVNWNYWNNIVHITILYFTGCNDTTTEEPTTTEIETTTTAQVPTTVQPSQCLDNVEGVNRTDATLDEECGAYSGTAKCIKPNSACTKIDSTWICRCSQGYAKKNGLCTQLPSELFTSKQSSLNLLESSQPGDQVTKIDFTEVQGLYKTKPVAEIIGQDSDVFRVQTVNTEMVIIALDKDLTKPKYEIFVVVSVTADGIVIRDFRHITITVNKDSVIREEIFIMDGTLKDSVVGLVCQSCLLFENMTKIDRDKIVTVQNDGVIITSKTINLNSIQGSTTIAYSTYVEIQQQSTSVTRANITIHIIRAEFECELPEDSVANTVVGNLKLNNPFSIDSSSEFQISGLSLTLGSVVLDYIEQSKVMKTLSISISDYTFDTTIMINVQDVNDKSPTFIAKPYNFFTLESAYPGLIVGVVSATDPDTNSDLKFIISPPDKLKINEYGIITIQGGFDSNTTSYNATVTVTDGPHPVSESVTVMIQQATTRNLGYKFVGNISENVEPPTLVRDVYIKNYKNYEFTDRSAVLDFSIDSLTGVVKNARAFDREKETEFKYTILANEENKLECTLVVIGEITITVTDQNDEPPVFTSHSYNATVMENALAEKVLVVPEISTTDKDLNPTVAYIISTYTDIFNIDSSTGTITTKSYVDRENTEVILLPVVATDGVKSVTTTVTVQILDDNDNNPQISSDQNSVSVSENSLTGAHVTTINATDADIGKNAEITFDLVSNFGGPFRINQTTGEITVTGKLDRETSETHGVSVYARDNGISIRSSSMSVTITVLDTNDNPPVFAFNELEVEFEEEKDCSNQITTVSATDADKPGTNNSRITYSLLSGTDNFTLDSSGILKCKNTLDYEDQASYRITVKAQDIGSPSLNSNQSVIIKLKDLNDNAPVFKSPPAKITIRYFSAIERVIELFKVTDKDSGENGRVTFSIGGSAAEFLNIDSTNGILRTKSNADKINGDYDLEVIAMDNGISRKQNTTSVTVTVKVPKQEINQRIQFTQQEINMTVNENRPIRSELESVSSKVRNTKSVTLKFEIIDRRLDLAFAVNQDSGMVTLSKSVDRETTDIHEFVVSVENDNDPTESDLVLVRVHIQDENDNKPTFVRSTYFFRVNENEVISTVVLPKERKIMATDDDIGDNAVIEFQLSGDGDYTECSSAFSLKNVGENTRSIQLSKKVDYEVLKKCKFSIEAYNPNNRTMSNSVDVTVDILDYNDNSPIFTGQSSTNIFTVDLLEDTTINEPQNFGTVKDADSGANGDIVLTVTNADCWVDVTKVEGTGEMILRLKENANIDYESGLTQKNCIIKASDKGASSLSSTVTLSMILIDVNDNRPVIANPNINKNVSRDADVGKTTIIVHSIPASDADSGENSKLSYSIQTSEHYLKFAIDANTGKITLNAPLVSVQKDKITIEVIVSDNGAIQLAATATVTIHILDENPRPYFSQSETVHIKEHVPQPNGILSTVTAFDRSGVTIDKCNCTYSLDTTRNDIIIESTTGTIKFINSNSVLDREGESHGKVIIGVIATETGKQPKNSKTMPFTIDIVDINDQSPAFEKLAYAFRIPQNAPEGTTIGTVTAIDLDENPITLYNISIRDNGGYDGNVVTIDEMTGKITTSGNLTIRSGQNAVIKGVVFAQDGNDTAKSAANSNFEITVEFDYNNKHAPVFQNTPYTAVINWNLAAGSLITEVNATDADSGRNSKVKYSITDNSKREFFTVNNDGVISLAYQLDSSLGNENTVKINLTLIAKDDGIIPKSSTTIVEIRITGENPGVCIQGAAHSKETKELDDERQNWSIAVYALVGLLCISLVASFFFVYKWRTSSPVKSRSEESNKKAYYGSPEYDELARRKTVEYSQSNEAFEPPRKDINFTDQDPYQKPYAQAGGASFKTSPYDEPIPDLKASSDEPKPDYPVYDWESKATKVLPPVVPSSFGSSS